MKYTLIIFLISLFSCSENKGSLDIETESQKEKSENLTSLNKCKLKMDSFSFKNFKIGMDLSDLKNIKELKEENLFVDEKIIQSCKVSHYIVTNVSQYTIFEKNINKITLSFFNQKLFEIKIELKDNIVLDLAKKFEVEDCVKDLYENDKEPSLSVSNEKFMLLSYSNSLYSLNTQPLFYNIDIVDVKIHEIVMYCLDEKKKRKSEDELKDF